MNWEGIKFDKPITGWRIWKVVQTAEGDRLGAVAHEGCIWKKGLLKAECSKGGKNVTWMAGELEPGAHAAPEVECSCGIYAYRTINDLMSDSDVMGQMHAGYIIGEVELGGEVIPHEYGWRAEYAQISKIWYSQNKGCCLRGSTMFAFDLRSGKDLADAYDCETIEPPVEYTFTRPNHIRREASYGEGGYQPLFNANGTYNERRHG